MKYPDARCKQCWKRCFSQPDELCGSCRNKARNFIPCCQCGHRQHESKIGSWIKTPAGYVCWTCQQKARIA